MHPTLLELGPVKLHSYGLLIAIGFLTALYFMRRDARRIGIDPQALTDLAVWALVLGIIGTRVLHIIMFPDHYSWSDPLGWIAIWRGGLVFQGALPPVILFCLYYTRKKKIPVWPFADVVCPYIPLAHAFGRLGCLMYGCCYGAHTDGFWGIRFPRIPFDLTLSAEGSPAYLDHARRFALEQDALWSLPVHPTQVIASISLLSMCGILLLLRKHWHPYVGFTFPVYLALYGVKRFFVEMLRGDHNPTHFGNHLSDQQIFCLAMIAVGVALFFALKRWNRSVPVSA